MAGDGAQPENDGGRDHVVAVHKRPLQSDALFEYILETSVYPREPEPMKELRSLTAKHPWSVMASTADESQFLSMLVKLMNAKKTMEIGVFTGYSLLATALALLHDGKILAMDIDRKSYELGLPIIEKAGVAHKIDFREGPALPLLDLLLQDAKNHGSFDFVFVDADKSNYANYHKRVVELVKIGGVVGYDNTLWGGPAETAVDDERKKAFLRSWREVVHEFNMGVAADPRIEIVMLAVGDGHTLCRRIE